MKITLLGTGTPYPDADRFGSAVLVEGGGRKLLFDCGRGVVTRLSETGVNPSDIDSLFLTHLHSDHVVGIPDLWLTGWFLGRKKPFRIWGPAETRTMAQHLSKAFEFDVGSRESTEQLPARGVEIDAQEIQQGKVYDDGVMRVTAFAVDHGPIKPAFGYRIDYSGHSVVLSGDTRFSENLIKFAKDTDCIIHVAWSVSSKNPTPQSLRSLASAEDAAQVFANVQPRLAVIYHYKDPEGLADAVRANYKGPFVVAEDLMSIVIDHAITWKSGSSSGSVQ
jgi:ribonuclease Z